jgi:hypothetical protein
VNQSGGRVRALAAVLLGGAAGAIGEYNLRGGVLSTARLMRAGGGRFNFKGGVLRADRVGFDLVNDGGVLAAGSLDAVTGGNGAPARAGHLNVTGDLSLRRGVLRVNLDRTTSDTFDVSGDVMLGGTLDVTPFAGCAPRDGDSWTLLTARGHIRGRFEQLPSGYRVEVTGQRLVLSYGTPPLAGRTSPGALIASAR